MSKLSEMDRNERLVFARELAERNHDYAIPVEMEYINDLYKDEKPLDILRQFLDDDFDIDCEYFMPDNGHGCTSMDDKAIEEWIKDTVDDNIEYNDADSFGIWDDEEYGEWLYKFRRRNLNDAISLDDDFPYSSDYHTHAEQFAIRWGVSLEILGYEYKFHFIEDKQRRYVFKCRLERQGEEYKFEFGQCLADGAKRPCMYDILACFTKSDPCTYKDFCAEFGYAGGEDSLAIYHGVKEEWSAVLRLFGPENGKCMEELREIC